MARTTFAMLALAAGALAAPATTTDDTAATATSNLLTGTEGTIASTIVVVNPTTPPSGVYHGVNIASPPEYLTFSIINSHGDTISTSHAHDPSAPSAVSGNVGPGTMTNGETAAFAVPTGWIGNVAINDAGWEITGDDSLIEGNFIVPDGYSVAVADIDVSYVNGFSVSIVCQCDDTVVTGCNRNLFNLNTCPDNDGENACVNPLRSDSDATAASTFFAPCEGAAWTYVNDSGANSFGQCQSGTVICCVGAACWDDPKEDSDPTKL